jgi:hypothetical protein
LHQNPTHARTGPVGLQKTWFRRVIASEAWGRSDVGLEGFPQGNKCRCPKIGRNGFAMMEALKQSEGLDADFEEGTVDVIKSEETYKRKQRLTGCWDGPVADEVEFGAGRAVAVGGYIMSDIFDAVCEEGAFFELESNPVFKKHGANAGKIGEKGVNAG